MYCAEILDAFSSLEDLAIVFDVDLSGIHTLRAALRRRNFVMMFLNRHIDCLERFVD